MCIRDRSGTELAAMSGTELAMLVPGGERAGPWQRLCSTSGPYADSAISLRRLRYLPTSLSAYALSGTDKGYPAAIGLRAC
eukprot:1510559-Rhodomonas_salina.1